MTYALLLAMQAAGMVTDYLGVQRQQELGKYGAKLQQAAINSQIEQNRLSAEDQSLQQLRQLRQSLGTQMAVFAARGTAPGAGSAVLSTQNLVRNFNEDERMRRMNLLSRESQLKAGKSISQLTQMGENSKLWKGFAQRTINRFPTSPAAWDKLNNSSFGLTEIT